MKKSNIIALLTISLALSSCSNGKWFGEKEKAPHPGKRENIFILDTKLQASSAIGKVSVTVPSQKEVNSWPISEVNQNILSAENNALAANISKVKSINIGNLSTSKDLPIVSPIIVGDNIFVIGGNQVRSYSISSRKINWATKLDNLKNKIFYGGGIIADNNILYVTNGNKELTAINSQNGEIKWKYSLPNISRSTAIVKGETVYISTIDNNLFALNKHDGSIIWTHQGPIESISTTKYPSVAANNNLVIIPYASGDIFILDSNTGQELMNINLSQNNIVGQGFSLKGISSTPLIDGSHAIITNNEGIILSLNLENGSVEWTKEITGLKDMWLADNFIYLSTNTGEIISIYKKNGEIKWVNEINISKKSNPLIHGPIMAGNNLLVGLSSGVIFEISPKDGSTLRQINLDSPLNGFPLVSSGQLFTVTNNSCISIWK